MSAEDRNGGVPPAGAAAFRHRPAVKICGLTRTEDVQLAADLGADFLGFVFVRSSPRCVEPAAVGRRGIGRREAGSPRRVGVFRDASLDDIHRAAEIAQLDVVQLHGSETEDFVRAVRVPVIKAVTLGTTSTSAQWLLYDSGGGTGRTFDWSLLANHPRTTPFFIAGGITPDNVADAIRIARPDGIDLSSGVESAPGIKDHDKLRLLFERVRRA